MISESAKARGYEVLDLFSEQEVAALREVVKQFMPESTQHFYLNIWQQDSRSRRQFSEKLEQIFERPRSVQLPGWESVVNAVALKKTGDDSGWGLHQDDTFVDETRFDSYSIWCPLEAVDAFNGAMRVWPGSHHFFRDFRSPNIAKPFSDYAERIEKQFMQVVEMKAGQALLFNHRLLHSSGPNLAGTPRVAVVSVLKPREADLIYPYYDRELRRLFIHRISRDFYLDMPLGEFSRKPDEQRFPVIGELEYVPSVLSWSDLVERISRYKQA